MAEPKLDVDKIADDFIDSISNVSAEVQFLTQEIRHRDRRVEALKERIHPLSARYLARASSGIVNSQDELAFNLINDYHETIRRLSEEKLRLVRRLHAFLEKHANRLQMNLDRINGIQKSQTQTQTDHLTDVAPATNTPARSEPVTHAESGDKSPIGISPDASIGDAIYILEGFLKEDSLNGFSTLLETSETIIKGPIIEDQSSVSSSANTTMKSHNSRISEAIPRDQDISASSSPVAAPLMNGATSGDETTLDDFGLDEILASVTISELESLKSPSSPATSEATLRSLLTDDDDGRTAFTGRSIIDEDESEEKARNIHDARQGDEEED